LPEHERGPPEAWTRFNGATGNNRATGQIALPEECLPPGPWQSPSTGFAGPPLAGEVWPPLRTLNREAAGRETRPLRALNPESAIDFADGKFISVLQMAICKTPLLLNSQLSILNSNETGDP
jgi:hypothetical protein